jgi:hypothetical protein
MAVSNCLTDIVTPIEVTFECLWLLAFVSYIRGFEYIRQFCVSEFMKKIKTQSAVCPRVGCSRRWGYLRRLGLWRPAPLSPWNGRLYPQLSGKMSDESGVESPRHTWVRKSTQASSACVLFCWQPIAFSIFPDTFSTMRGRGKNTRTRGGKRGKREVKEKERQRAVQKRSAKEGGRIVLESAPL